MFLKSKRTSYFWTVPKWTRGGIGREQLREYTAHHFRGAWALREDYLMSQALELLVDASTRPPTFRLTPGEFAEVVRDHNVDGESALAFLERLRLAVARKCGFVPKTRGSVSEALLQIVIDSEAPDYIRESKLPVAVRHALWKARNPFENPFAPAEERELYAKWEEPIKRGIAKLDRIGRKEGEKVDETIDRLIRETFERWRARAKMDRMSETDLARLIAVRLPLYDKKKDAEALDELTAKLAALTKVELMVLEKYTEEKMFFSRHVEMFKTMVTKGGA